MNCKDIENKLIDYLDNKLTKTEQNAVELHLKNCESCQKELNQLQLVITAISEEKEEIPSSELRSNFKKILQKELKKETTAVVAINTNKWKTYLQVAASILVLVSAFLLGKYQNTLKNTVAVVNKEQSSILAMFNNTSASKRILAVNNSQKFTKENTVIIQAIIDKLFYDENTNVRLAAAEALAKFSSLEMVKKALVKALETEKDPMIQIELIHILAKIQEKRALTPMKRLLNQEETPNYVKHELASTITNLL